MPAQILSATGRQTLQSLTALADHHGLDPSSIPGWLPPTDFASR
jgi:hypothetical protein